MESDTYRLTPGAPPARILAPWRLVNQKSATQLGHRRIASVPFTLRNFRRTSRPWAHFDGAPDLEFRLATVALELEQSGLATSVSRPADRLRYGDTHKTQEEVYVVLRGSGRMSSTTRSSSSRSGTRCASRPVRGEVTRPGRRARDHRHRRSQLGEAPREDVEGQRDWWSD